MVGKLKRILGLLLYRRRKSITIEIGEREVVELIAAVELADEIWGCDGEPCGDDGYMEPDARAAYEAYRTTKGAKR